MAEPSAFSVYIEREFVGKRFKKSKVKVTWHFAFSHDLVVHVVELAHSAVSGKRVIKYDSKLSYLQKLKKYTKHFEHSLDVEGNHQVLVTITDSQDGAYKYDLVVDGVKFHNLPHKALGDLGEARKRLQGGNAAPKVASFSDFTGKSAAASLDAPPVVVAADKPQEDLLGDIWGDSQHAQVQQPPAFDPFAGALGQAAPPPAPEFPSFDEFAASDPFAYTPPSQTFSDPWAPPPQQQQQNDFWG